MNAIAVSPPAVEAHQRQIDLLNELAAEVASDLYDRSRLIAKLEEDLADLQQGMESLRRQIETCPGQTDFQRFWLPRAKRRRESLERDACGLEIRLPGMKRKIDWLDRRLTGIKLQIDYHAAAIRRAVNGRQAMRDQTVGTAVTIIGTDKPMGNGFAGNRKNHKQVKRSREDAVMRGRLSSGKKSGRKDGKQQNARGKKARKQQAMQAA